MSRRLMLGKKVEKPWIVKEKITTLTPQSTGRIDLTGIVYFSEITESAVLEATVVSGTWTRGRINWNTRLEQLRPYQNAPVVLSILNNGDDTYSIKTNVPPSMNATKNLHTNYTPKASEGAVIAYHWLTSGFYSDNCVVMGTVTYR